MPRFTIVFVPQEDENGYLLFSVNFLPRVGERFTVDRSIRPDTEDEATYEVVGVAHYASRKFIASEEHEGKGHVESEYDAIVTGRLLDAEHERPDEGSSGS